MVQSRFGTFAPPYPSTRFGRMKREKRGFASPMARVSFILVDLTVSLSDLCSKLIKIEYFYML